MYFTGRQMGAAAAAMVWWMAPAAAFAQGIGQMTGINAPLPREPGVLRVYTVGVDATYYSVGLPYGDGALPPGAPQRPAFGSGGSFSMGWSDIRENSTTVVGYAGSYATQTGYTGTSALNQSLFWDWQRKIKRQWNLKFAGNAAIATRDQYLYTPVSGSGNPEGASAGAPPLSGGPGIDSGGGAGFAGTGSATAEPLG
jgi:hypothetical protein